VKRSQKPKSSRKKDKSVLSQEGDSQSILAYLGTSSPWSPPPMPEFLKEEFRYLLCQCHSTEHSATIFFDQDEWYLAVHLRDHRSFWRRLWSALKYLFRRDSSKFGHWDELIFRRDDLLQIKKMLSTL
jgi:hypothetical protein